VELPASGTSLEPGQPFATIEAVKTVIDLNSPITGEVIEVNDSVTNDPSVVNQSPYEEGWLIKARMSNPSEMDGLLSAEDYDELVKGLGAEG
jgi:glycine cleavage system H protein